MMNSEKGTTPLSTGSIKCCVQQNAQKQPLSVYLSAEGLVAGGGGLYVLCMRARVWVEVLEEEARAFPLTLLFVTSLRL